MISLWILGICGCMWSRYVGLAVLHLFHTVTDADPIPAVKKIVGVRADSARPLHYSKSDSRLARVPALSPCYSLTHAHRSIGYRNHNPQLLAESAARLMYLRVYDSRDSSHQPVPSASLCYSLTLTHNTLPTPTLITITCTQVLWFLERLTRPTVSGAGRGWQLIGHPEFVRACLVYLVNVPLVEINKKDYIITETGYAVT